MHFLEFGLFIFGELLGLPVWQTLLKRLTYLTLNSHRNIFFDEIFHHGKVVYVVAHVVVVIDQLLTYLVFVFFEIINIHLTNIPFDDRFLIFQKSRLMIAQLILLALQIYESLLIILVKSYKMGVINRTLLPKST